MLEEPQMLSFECLNKIGTQPTQLEKKENPKIIRKIKKIQEKLKKIKNNIFQVKF